MYWSRPQEEPVKVTSNANINLSVAEQKRRLPITGYRKEILWCVERNNVTIVVGETGSGKSTQVPQYLVSSGWCTSDFGVLHILPRKFAAITIANRISVESELTVGNEIRVSISPNEVTAHKPSSLHLITAPLLSRILQYDPLLAKYSVVILDDVHERSVDLDLACGLLKRIMKIRKSLRVLVLSALFDVEDFSKYFSNIQKRETKWGVPAPKKIKAEDPVKAEVKMEEVEPRRRRRGFDDPKEKSGFSDAPPGFSDPPPPPEIPLELQGPLNDVCVMSVEGRMFPVEVKYLTHSTNDYVVSAITTVLSIDDSKKFGDILVFLVTEADIARASHLLDQETNRNFYIAPLHPSLSTQKQLEAFKRASGSRRKIVLATNIAESSITIDNIVFVIDSGLQQISFYHPIWNVNCLNNVSASKASLYQRAGRAGRVAPGAAYRLLTEGALQTLNDVSIPELLSCDLSSVILNMKGLGVTNIINFEFVTPPSAPELAHAMEKLYHLQFMKEDGSLTPMGLQAAELPLRSPECCRMLLKSTEEQFSCSEEVLTICAMMASPEPWTQSKNAVRLEACKNSFSVAEGDLVTMQNVMAHVRFYREADSGWINRHMIDTESIRQAETVRNHLSTILGLYQKPIVSCGEDVTKLCKCIASGFFLNAVQRHRKGFYVHIRKVDTTDRIPDLQVHPSSILYADPPQWMVYADCLVSNGQEGHIKELTKIDVRWLPEVAPHFFEAPKFD